MPSTTVLSCSFNGSPVSRYFSTSPPLDGRVYRMLEDQSRFNYGEFPLVVANKRAQRESWKVDEIKFASNAPCHYGTQGLRGCDRPFTPWTTNPTCKINCFRIKTRVSHGSR